MNTSLTIQRVVSDFAPLQDGATNTITLTYYSISVYKNQPINILPNGDIGLEILYRIKKCFSDQFYFLTLAIFSLPSPSSVSLLTPHSGGMSEDQKEGQCGVAEHRLGVGGK